MNSTLCRPQDIQSSNMHPNFYFAQDARYFSIGAISISMQNQFDALSFSERGNVLWV